MTTSTGLDPDEIKFDKKTRGEKRDWYHRSRSGRRTLHIFSADFLREKLRIPEELKRQSKDHDRVDRTFLTLDGHHAGDAEGRGRTVGRARLEPAGDHSTLLRLIQSS
jgi:hypothetical protein